MDHTDLIFDLTKLVEYKISAANKYKANNPLMTKIIAIQEREIFILNQTILFIENQAVIHSNHLIRCQLKAYENGKRAGILSERTGRCIDFSPN